MTSYPVNPDSIQERGDIESILRATPTFGKKFESTSALNVPSFFTPRNNYLQEPNNAFKFPPIPKNPKRFALIDGITSSENQLQSPSKVQQPYFKFSPVKPEYLNLKSYLISNTEPTEGLGEHKIMKPIKFKKPLKSTSNLFRPPKPIDPSRKIADPPMRLELSSKQVPILQLQNTLSRPIIQISPRSPNLTINKTLTRHQRYPSGSNLPVIDTGLKFELPQVPHSTTNASSKMTLRNMKIQFRLDPISNIHESQNSEDCDAVYFPHTKFNDPDSTRTGSRVEGSTTIISDNENFEVKKSIHMPQIPQKSGSHGGERKKVKIPPISKEIPEVFRIYSKQEMRPTGDSDIVASSPMRDLLSPRYNTITRKYKSSKALVLSGNEENLL